MVLYGHGTSRTEKLGSSSHTFHILCSIVHLFKFQLIELLKIQSLYMRCPEIRGMFDGPDLLHDLQEGNSPS